MKKEYYVNTLIDFKKEKKIYFSSRLLPYVEKIIQNNNYENSLYFPFINDDITEKEFKKLLKIFKLKHDKKSDILLIGKKDGFNYD